MNRSVSLMSDSSKHSCPRKDQKGSSLSVIQLIELLENELGRICLGRDIPQSQEYNNNSGESVFGEYRSNPTDQILANNGLNGLVQGNNSSPKGFPMSNDASSFSSIGPQGFDRRNRIIGLMKKIELAHTNEKKEHSLQQYNRISKMEISLKYNQKKVKELKEEKIEKDHTIEFLQRRNIDLGKLCKELYLNIEPERSAKIQIQEDLLELLCKEYEEMDEHSYKGDTFSGKKHGKGTFTDSKGTTYAGTFMNDMKHGKFKITYVPSEVELGLEEDGEYREDQEYGLHTVTCRDRMVQKVCEKESKVHVQKQRLNSGDTRYFNYTDLSDFYKLELIEESKLIRVYKKENDEYITFKRQG